MTRPPQKLPMGNPPAAGPAKPAPRPFRPQPNKPGGAKKSGGPSIVLILLGIFGGLGLIVVLACGGFIWYVSSQVQKDLAERDAQRAAQTRSNQARANSNNNRPNPTPWNRPTPRPPTPRPSPNDQAIDSLAKATTALDENSHFRRQEALRYLKEQPIQDNQRDAVVAKALPLLSDWHGRSDAKAVLERWVSADQISHVASAADAARGRNDRDTQRAAIEVLAALGPDAAPHLLPHMNDSDSSLRRTVRDALTRWEANQVSLARQSLRDLQAGPLQGGDVQRAREAAQWLAKNHIDDEQLSPRVAAALVALMQNSNTRNDAMQAFQVWATADSATELLPLIHDQDYRTRQMARTLLEKWEVDSSQWIKQSLADLKSGEENRQREAMRYLASVEAADADQDAVASSLIDLADDQRLRHDAMRALHKWATADTVPRLIELLEHDDRGVQSEATRILLALKDPRAVGPLTAGYGDDESANRYNAARHIEALGPVAESVVWPHVTNPNWIHAKGACELLGRIGTVKSIPILEAAKQHEQTFVRSAAERAIAEIETAKREPVAVSVGGDDFDDGPRTMRTWTDASGENKIEALFIEFASGKVRLRTRNGRFLSLKLDQLSPADREYVIRQVQR